MTEIRKNVIISIICSILVLCILMFAAAHQPEPEGTGEYRLKVFDTSDIHGALIYELREPYEYKVAYIADKINDARMDGDSIDTDRVLLLDGGDIYQGNALSLLSEGEAMSAVYDEMKYDAVALGNHEFDWGIETVIDKDGTMRDYETGGEKRTNSIPFLCCNIYKDGEKIDFAQDCLTVSKKAVDASGKEKPVKIGVIGYAEDYSYSIAGKNFIDLGYTVDTNCDEVNRLAQELEEKKGCDAVILLAHGAADEIAEALGEETCIDLVLGGHIHKNLNDRTEWGLRYMSPAGNGVSYLYDELVFENDGRGGLRIKEGADDEAAYYKTIEDPDKLHDTEENADELDKAVVDITNDYIDRIRPYLEQEIGYITEPVTKDYLEESENRVSTAGNFICDGMMLGADVDVAIINRSGVRTNLFMDEGEDKRPVTKLDMFSMLPFDDAVYCYEMTYADLLNVLEFSMNGGGFNLLSCVKGIDCYAVHDPDDDGSGKYPRMKVGALVRDGDLIYKDGKWFNGWENKTLRLAAPEYSATAKANSKDGSANPLYEYNSTDRLISNDMLLRDCVIDGLTKEAEANSGHLDVDNRTHVIYRAYDGDVR